MRHGVVHRVRLGLRPRQRLFAVDVDARGRGVLADARVPVVGRRHDDGVDFPAREHVGVGAKAARRRARRRPVRAHLRLRRGDAPLRPHVEQVADAGEHDVEVLLVEVHLELLVPRVIHQRLPRIAHEVGVRKAGVSHQRFALTAHTNDAEPDAAARRAGDRVRNDGRAAFGDSQLRQDRRLLRVVLRLLLQDVVGEAAEHGHRHERLQQAAPADPRPVRRSSARRPRRQSSSRRSSDPPYASAACGAAGVTVRVQGRNRSSPYTLLVGNATTTSRALSSTSTLFTST